MGFIVFLIAVVFLVIKAMQDEDEKEAIKVTVSKRMQEELIDEGYNFSKKIPLKAWPGNYIPPDSEIAFDFVKEELVLLEYNKGRSTKIPFGSILDCEIIEDNSTIQKGGIGRSIVGGAIAGGTGAIVGAVTRKSKNIVENLAVRVITNDAVNAMKMFVFLDSETKRDSEKYKYSFHNAQELYSTIFSIIYTQNRKLE